MASLLAFFLYPDFGLLFIVNPIDCAGELYFIDRIRPGDIDHNAARGLLKEDEEEDSTTLACQDKTNDEEMSDNAFYVLCDPTLLVFTAVIFLFHVFQRNHSSPCHAKPCNWKRSSGDCYERSLYYQLSRCYGWERCATRVAKWKYIAMQSP